MAATVITVILWVLLAALAIAVLVLIYVNVRARNLNHRVGSFRCWARPDPQAGWTSGVAQYETDTLNWYRLVGFSGKPVFSLPRKGMEVSPPKNRATDGSVVEVRVSAGDQRWEFAIQPESYNGLVSWIESGPPGSGRKFPINK